MFTHLTWAEFELAPEVTHKAKGKISQEATGTFLVIDEGSLYSRVYTIDSAILEQIKSHLDQVVEIEFKVAKKCYASCKIVSIKKIALIKDISGSKPKLRKIRTH